MSNQANIGTGVLTTLKHVKKNVNEMSKGSECGISFKDWDKFEQGDLIQCYTEIKEARQLR